MLSQQKKYNKKVLKDISSDEQRDQITQNLALCTHAELSSLVNAVNYKHHHGDLGKINKSTILYESVDVVRYMLAILNVWDVDSKEFKNAFHKKDIYLHARKRIDDNPWQGQPVVIVDIDDVLAEFRNCFAKWLVEKKNIHPNIESNEYYFINALKKSNENPEQIFFDFMDDDGFLLLDRVQGSVDFLNHLKSLGYWLHMLTARPETNLMCFYSTYQWLTINKMPFDDLSFSNEKFRWCAQSKYYDSGAIQFAIDDSPKHAMEYARHGIRVKVPAKSYNIHIEHDNVQFYEDFNDLINKIKTDTNRKGGNNAAK